MRENDDTTNSFIAPECPYCGNVHDDDLAAWTPDTDTTEERECEKCGKTFLMTVSHFTAWDCEKIS